MIEPPAFKVTLLPALLNVPTVKLPGVVRFRLPRLAKVPPVWL